MLEHFTNVTNSTIADYLLDNEIRKYPNDLLDIRYHTTFPGTDVLANAYKAGTAARALYYRIPSVPYTIVDGNYDENSYVVYSSQVLAGTMIIWIKES